MQKMNARSLLFHFAAAVHCVFAGRRQLEEQAATATQESVLPDPLALQLEESLQSITLQRWQGQHDQDRQRSSNLVAFTAANVGHRTTGLLASLSTVHDDFDLLAIDEKSTDHTQSELKRYGVEVLRYEDYLGVTALWNEVYRYFVQHSYEALFIINNDVLVPDGVVTKLRAALDIGCDLVAPLSTMLGKGHRGMVESIEVLFGLSNATAALVNNPAYYQAVQQQLDNLYGDKWGEAIVHKSGEFNGFFFAVSRRVASVAYSEQELFRTPYFNFEQERDLTNRMEAAGLNICLHKGTFVYHFKGATIPVGNYKERLKWKRQDL